MPGFSGHRKHGSGPQRYCGRLIINEMEVERDSVWYIRVQCISTHTFTHVIDACIRCGLNVGLHVCRTECINYFTTTYSSTRCSSFLSIEPSEKYS